MQSTLELALKLQPNIKRVCSHGDVGLRQILQPDGASAVPAV